MKRRKTLGLLVSISVLSIAAAGCSKEQSLEEFNFEKEITVVARDAASVGISSRELKEDEALSLQSHVLAIDGIAVILNKNNPTNDFSSEKITGIYTGKITSWG